MYSYSSTDANYQPVQSETEIITDVLENRDGQEFTAKVEYTFEMDGNEKVITNFGILEGRKDIEPDDIAFLAIKLGKHRFECSLNFKR